MQEHQRNIDTSSSEAGIFWENWSNTTNADTLYVAILAAAVRVLTVYMMTSSNGYIFRVTGHLCGDFTGPRWIPHTKASDAIVPIMTPL